MITLQAEIDESLFALIGRIRQFNADAPLSILFPAAAQAVKGASAAIESQWKAYASGEPLPSGDRVKHPTGGYAASITTKADSLWSYRVFSPISVAHYLEEGTAELDMKQTHPYGPRGRVAKKKIPGGGFRYVPYVIIPFRWATQGSGAHMGPKNVIPDQVYKALTKGIRKNEFSRSVVLDGKTASPNFWGEMQTRAMYQWGDRLKGVGGNLEGLVAMNGDYDNKGDGTLNRKTRYSTYFTFRVISADSPADKWIKPATKPLKIAEQTAAFMRGKVNDMIEAGFKSDLEGMI
jgi:hypothetical protein